MFFLNIMSKTLLILTTRPSILQNPPIMERKYDLDERLINFAAAVIDVSEALPNTLAGRHVAGQLVRCGTAPALHYGEAQGAESRKDFIHKLKIGLKELRESFNCHRIVRKKKWYDEERLTKILDENNQLISIFVKSIETARKNLGDNPNE